jgi:ankyrin repeat protein
MTTQPKTQPTVNATDKEQRTFVINCWNGKMDDVVDVLAQRPDAVHWRDPGSGNTGLTYTAGSGTMAYDVAVLLLGAKADVNAQNNEGYTALHFAARGASESFVELLLAHGADITVRDNEGNTAGDLAHQKGHTWVLKLIEKHTQRNAAAVAAAEQARADAAKQEMEKDISKLQNGSTAPVVVRKKPLQIKPF